VRDRRLHQRALFVVGGTEVPDAHDAQACGQRACSAFDAHWAEMWWRRTHCLVAAIRTSAGMHLQTTQPALPEPKQRLDVVWQHTVRLGNELRSAQ
jgi:hypothetical protein